MCGVSGRPLDPSPGPPRSGSRLMRMRFFFLDRLAAAFSFLARSLSSLSSDELELSEELDSSSSSWLASRDL